MTARNDQEGTMDPLKNEKLKKLSVSSAQKLAEKLRRTLVDNVTVTGGHLASNLGVVEISIALLRCFDPPHDKIIYDTGHQSYVHKLLTGRAGKFETLRQSGGISGFPRMDESPYDAFGTGHSSTGISAALGYCAAARLLEDDPGWCVVVIGDGAFTNGMVFEALNNVKRSDRLIIILNDNGMSISKNVGALAEQLYKLRMGDSYYDVMEKSRKAITSIPVVGKPVAGAIVGVKKRLKRAVVVESNIFEQYGIRYFGPADGNDLATVERLIRVAKKQNSPCIIHLHTKKGKGYAPAENSPCDYHSVGAKSSGAKPAASFSTVYGETLTELAQSCPRIAAITAAMCDGVGLTEFAKRFPERFFDVGIAEEHALTCAAAMAAGGLTPFLSLYSTFFQRAYDQFLHDAALQKLGAVIALDRAGIVGEDGPTHHGLFDVSMTLNVPNASIWSPATYAELRAAMTEIASAGRDGKEKLPGPAVLRIPKGVEDPAVAQAFPCRGEAEIAGPKNAVCAVISYGREVSQALKASRLLEADGIPCAVIKMTRLKKADLGALNSALESLPDLKLVTVAEEGMRRGGFGEALAAEFACGRLGRRELKFDVFAVEDRFVPHGKTSELLALCGIDAESLRRRIKEDLK